MSAKAVERVRRLLRDWPSNESVVLLVSDVRAVLQLAEMASELEAANFKAADLLRRGGCELALAALTPRRKRAAPRRGSK